MVARIGNNREIVQQRLCRDRTASIGQRNLPQAQARGSCFASNRCTQVWSAHNRSNSNAVQSRSKSTRIRVTKRNSVDPGMELHRNDDGLWIAKGAAVDIKLDRRTIVDSCEEGAWTLRGIVHLKLVHAALSNCHLIKGHAIARTCSKATDNRASRAIRTSAHAGRSSQRRGLGLIGSGCTGNRVTVSTDNDAVESRRKGPGIPEGDRVEPLLQCDRNSGGSWKAEAPSAQVQRRRWAAVEAVFIRAWVFGEAIHLHEVSSSARGLHIVEGDGIRARRTTQKSGFGSS